MESAPQTRPPSKSMKKPTRKSETERCLTVITNVWGEEIAKIFKYRSEKMAKLGRTLAIRHYSWTEMSNMVNITICGRVLEAHKTEGKGKAKDEKKVTLQPKDLIKISGLTESTTESCDMLIKELSLLGVNVKIGKNGIVELDGNDPALSTSPSTSLPAHQRPFPSPAPFDCVPRTVKDTPKPQRKETTHMVGCLASNPEHTRLDTVPPQCHGSPSTLASAPQLLPSTTLPVLLLEAFEPDHSLPRKASKPDCPPHHKTTEPDLSPKHEAAGIHISPQQVATEPVLLTQHEAAEPNHPLQHKTAKTNPSLKSDAAGTHTSPQQEPGPSGQHKAAEPDLSFQHKAGKPDSPLRHEAAEPDASSQHSLQHNATESDREAFHVPARAPKRRYQAIIMENRAGVKRKAVVDHKKYCENATTDCSCCRMTADFSTRWHKDMQSERPGSFEGGLALLGALKYRRDRRGYSDLCILHFKRLVMKLGLSYTTGSEKILFERIEEIWDARESSEQLSSLTSRYPSWFTNTQDPTATSAKSSSTSTTCESGAKEERIKNVLTPTACISGHEKRNFMNVSTPSVSGSDDEKTNFMNFSSSSGSAHSDKERLKHMNLHDAITTFSDEDVATAAHLDVCIVSEFRNLLGAGNECARSIGKLPLLHNISYNKDSEKIYAHQSAKHSPHGPKIVLDLPHMMTFCEGHWLSGQGIDGALADLVDPPTPEMQILSSEVGYLISSKINGLDQRPTQDCHIPDIKPGATTIIMPWNMRNNHWIVIKTTCNKNRGSVTVYDSLRAQKKKATKTEVVEVMRKITQRNVSHPWHECSWSERDVQYSSVCAQQKGSNDCGVHTIYNTLTLAKGKEPTKRALDYPALRKAYLEAYCRFFGFIKD